MLTVLTIVATLLSLYLAVLTFLKNWRAPRNISFSILSGIMSIWAFCFIFYETPIYFNSLFWIKTIYLLVVGMIASMLYFSYAFPDNERTDKRVMWGYALLQLPIIYTLLFTNLFVVEVITNANGVETRLGPMYYFVLLIWMGAAFIILSNLVKKFRKSNGSQKLQLKYMFWGLGLFSLTASIFDGIVPLVFHTSYFFSYSALFSLLFVVITSYAIIRHRLMDIRIAFQEFVVFLLSWFLVSVMILASALAYWAAKSEPVKFDVIPVVIGISLILSLLYARVVQWARIFASKYLFGVTYDYQKTLRDLINAINASVDFSSSLREVYAILSAAVSIKSAIFVVKVTDKNKASNLISTSFGDFAMYSYGEVHEGFLIDATFFQIVDRNSTCFTIDDVREEYSKTKRDEYRSFVLWAEKFEVGAVLPLIRKDDLIGFIILGNKSSNDIYTLQDIELFESLALQASTSIENILLFMHSQDFSQVLKAEVDTATSELQQKNKNLEVLRKMDSIIMTTLDPKEISQKIVDTIAWELGYDGAILSIVDYKRSLIVPTAVSKTPLIDRSLKLVARSIEEYCTPLNAPKSLAVQSLMLKTKIVTTSLADAFEPVLPRIVSDGIQKIVGMKGVIIYPIMSKDQPLGVLTLATHKLPHDMTPAEHNLLDAFMDEVAIALENAYLYEEARNVNTMLYKTNKDLVGLDKMKDEFVSIASHELRTPMTAINGYVWMLLQGKGGAVSDKQKYYLERVAQSTQRLINLVNDMLSVSRIESGRIQITLGDFDIVDLVKSVHEELQIKADEKKISFAYSAVVPALQVKADPDKVREVVTNLLGNAMKFTEKGSIATKIEEIDGKVRVAVTDTGRGVAQEDMPKLFQKFGRLDNTFSTVASTSGTGLGLYICKKYIEAMGGSFEVQSEVGKGSTFAFYLPKS